MPAFGTASKRFLAELHPDLQRVANEAIKVRDFSIICGYRGRDAQNLAFSQGRSRARFGQSPHNFKPSFAMDVIPYPFNGWHVIADFERVGNEIMHAANRVGVKVTWGKNFKGLVDYPHFELTDWRNLK